MASWGKMRQMRGYQGMDCLGEIDPGAFMKRNFSHKGKEHGSYQSEGGLRAGTLFSARRHRIIE
jgi:hypothetical protein